MKIPCPSCSQQLNLPDRFAGKITKCPACQQSFEVPGAPEGSPAAGKAQANITPSIPKGGELALDSLMEEKKHQEGPPELSVCPSCGTGWKKDATECKKCHYNIFIGGKARRPPSRKLNFNIDIQQIFLYAAIVGVIYGGYWLYNNFGDIKRKGDKAFDDAARGHPSEEDDTVMKRKDPKKPDEK